MSRSNEAIWWSLFSAGGVMAALFIPAMMLATGFLLPVEDASRAAAHYTQVYGVASFWLWRILLFVVISLAMFHCAHRIRHTLMDLGLRAITPVLMLVCYGSALVGVGFAAVILWRL